MIGRAGVDEIGNTNHAADIVDRADIEVLISAFYRRALADPLLGPIFIDIARVDLRVHLPVMCDF